MKILLIEDEKKVATSIKAGLETNQFVVDLALDGYEGERLFKAKVYDLVVLDRILPSLDGIELCKRIKEQRPEIPVLMLTALGTLDDKMTGFDAGSDDYLVKPFEFKELLARIKALLKRSSAPKSSVTPALTIADLRLDLDKKMAFRSDKSIQLTAKEFALLEFLLRNKGRVVSKTAISEKVWDHTFDTGTNVVEVYINILRKKIDKNHPVKLLHTRIGLGYIMEEVQ